MNPTQEVLEFIKKRSPRVLGKELSEFETLDVFAGAGERVAKDYVPLVKFPTLWEIDKSKEDALIALVNAHKGGTVQIVDSYEWVRKDMAYRYDLVIIDNYLAAGERVEHFGLFPHIWKFLADKAYLMLFVVGDPEHYLSANPKKDEVLPKIQAARDSFYMTPIGEDPSKSMIERYTSLAEEAGYEVTWSAFTMRASNTAHWLTLEVVKKVLMTEDMKTKVLPLKGTAYLVQPEPEPEEPKLTTSILKVRKTDDHTNYFKVVKSIEAEIITFDEQINLSDVTKRYLVIRHDIDDEIDKALLFAFTEQAHGIRSTYFILPTAKYFDYSEALGKKLCDMVRLGHEIGYHNNALVEYRSISKQMKDLGEKELWKINNALGLADVIKNPLDWMRSLGIEVNGTACHGDNLCRIEGFNNYEVWEECQEKSRQKPKGYFPSYPLSHFGLKYEAYFVRRDAYLSESGSRWYGAVKPQIPPFEVYDQTDLKKTIETFNNLDAGIMQLLIHPQWWSVEA